MLHDERKGRRKREKKKIEQLTRAYSHTVSLFFSRARIQYISVNCMKNEAFSFTKYVRYSNMNRCGIFLIVSKEKSKRIKRNGMKIFAMRLNLDDSTG